MNFSKKFANLKKKKVSKDVGSLTPSAEFINVNTATMKEVITKTKSNSSIIKILNTKIKNLESIISDFQEEDTPYKISTMSGLFQCCGREQDQATELIKISEYIFRSKETLSEMLQQVEAFPLKLRDKMLLTVLITTTFMKEKNSERGFMQ